MIELGSYAWHTANRPREPRFARKPGRHGEQEKPIKSLAENNNVLMAGGRLASPFQMILVLLEAFPLLPLK